MTSTPQSVFFVVPGFRIAAASLAGRSVVEFAVSHHASKTEGLCSALTAVHIEAPTGNADKHS
jgi:hypothetical protein